MPKTTPLECCKQHYTQTTRIILARCSNDADNKLMQSHELIEQALESELERVRESMRELINRNGWNK